MRKLYIYLMLLVVLAMGTVAPALAQPEGEEEGGGSTVIGLTDLENIQQLVTERNGIVVCYVLPQGWVIGEQGVDKATGELMENINRYVLVSRSPVVDEDDAPDCTFELSIFEHGLFDEMPAGLSKEEEKEYEAQAFLAFLDVQISEARLVFNMFIEIGNVTGPEPAQLIAIGAGENECHLRPSVPMLGNGLSGPMCRR